MLFLQIVWLFPKKMLILQRILKKGNKIMSATQLQASEQFLDAMGAMIYDSQKMQQVLLYISSLRQSTISEEQWNSLATIEELDNHLQARIREHYTIGE